MRDQDDISMEELLEQGDEVELKGLALKFHKQYQDRSRGNFINRGVCSLRTEDELYAEEEDRS